MREHILLTHPWPWPVAEYDWPVADDGVPGHHVLHQQEDLIVRMPRRLANTKLVQQQLPRSQFEAEVAQHLLHVLGVDAARAAWVASVERHVECHSGRKG